jgi:hypothetical protein
MRALLVATCVLASVARAEESLVVERPNYVNPNLVVSNPGDLFTGTISIEYERALHPRFGVTAAVWGAFTKNLFLPIEAPSYNALGGELGVRVHFIRAAPGGLWVAPTINLGTIFSNDAGTPLARGWSWGASANVGYTFLLGRYLTMQTGLGVGFNDYGSGLVWSPRLRLAAGVVF